MLAEKICAINEKIGEVVWGLPMVAFLILGGLMLSFSCGFIQFRRLGASIKETFSGIFGGRAPGDTVTPFEAVCTALAGTIGTGNIAGVMIALTLGGPGAIFWMWISALIGMGTKYAEIVLAVKYREKYKDEYRGGPMYYIKNGLGERFRWLAVLFCVFGAVAAFGIGNMMQIGSIMTAAQNTATIFLPYLAGRRELNILLGAAMAVICGITMSGGAKGRGRLAAFLVPVMAVFYIAGALWVIIVNAENLPAVFKSIFTDAFTGAAVLGGAAGGGVRHAVSWGFKRGMFSNEAGLGSSPIAHASANVKSPARQGLLGVFEVFADTIVMCTITGLMVLVSGVPVEYGIVGGAEYCTAALATVFGEEISSVFMSLSMALFAFSSIVGWSLYGERCAEFLLGERAVPVYRAVYTAVVFLSAFMSFKFIIQLSDTMNALMILPNMTALIALMPVLKKETAVYLKNKKYRPR